MTLFVPGTSPYPSYLSQDRPTGVQVMAGFGVRQHAHVQAALLAMLLTAVTYGIKWLFGFTFPGVIFVLPTFMAIFIGFYLILFVLFLILWSRR